MVVLGATKSTMQIVSRTSIAASKSQVYQLLANYQRFPEWSPFLVADPQQKHWVTGQIGEVGSKFHWVGVSEESEGYQEIKSLVVDKSLEMACTITKPFESKPTFSYDLSANGQNTLVTQTFQMPCSLIEKWMLQIFGVQTEIATTNTLGLSLLKKAVEKTASLQ